MNNNPTSPIIKAAQNDRQFNFDLDSIELSRDGGSATMKASWEGRTITLRLNDPRHTLTEDTAAKDFQKQMENVVVVCSLYLKKDTPRITWIPNQHKMVKMSLPPIGDHSLMKSKAKKVPLASLRISLLQEKMQIEEKKNLLNQTTDLAKIAKLDAKLTRINQTLNLFREIPPKDKVEEIQLRETKKTGKIEKLKEFTKGVTEGITKGIGRKKKKQAETSSTPAGQSKEEPAPKPEPAKSTTSEKKPPSRNWHFPKRAK